MYSFILTEKKIEIDTDKIQFQTYPELVRWAKKIKIFPKETNKPNIKLEDGEYAIPLKNKSTKKQLNIKTGRLKKVKQNNYIKTTIKPEDRTLKNIPLYADGKPKVRFQSWLNLVKSPKLYDKLNDVSWGWSSNGKCYGWSHRAIAGFKVGQTVPKDTSGNPTPGKEWVIKTKEQAEKMAKLFAQNIS
jgi:hypothetical protein